MTSTVSSNVRVEVRNIVQSLTRRLQASISAPEQRPHIGWHQGIGHAVENSFALNVAQVKRASQMQIDNLPLAEQRANPRLPGSIFKSHKFHRIYPAANASQILLRKTNDVHAGAPKAQEFPQCSGACPERSRRVLPVVQAFFAQ